MNNDNYFKELLAVDCSNKVEKKGKFNYLSWAFAVEQVGAIHPDWTYDIKRFDGMPYLKSELGYFVEVGVTINGIERTEMMPVLDNRNQPIASPTTFDINTTTKRTLVKAIAMHGLGLYIYAGEDLPSDEYRPIYTDAQRNTYLKLLEQGEALAFRNFYMTLDEDVKVASFNSFDKGEKVANKNKVNELDKAAIDAVMLTADEINEAVIKDSDHAVLELLSDFSEYKALKQDLWRKISKESQDYITNLRDASQAA